MVNLQHDARNHQLNSLLPSFYGRFQLGMYHIANYPRLATRDDAAHVSPLVKKIQTSSCNGARHPIRPSDMIMTIATTRNRLLLPLVNFDIWARTDVVISGWVLWNAEKGCILNKFTPKRGDQPQARKSSNALHLVPSILNGVTNAFLSLRNRGAEALRGHFLLPE